MQVSISMHLKPYFCHDLNVVTAYLCPCKVLLPCSISDIDKPHKPFHGYDYACRHAVLLDLRRPKL